MPGQMSRSGSSAASECVAGRDHARARDRAHGRGACARGVRRRPVPRREPPRPPTPAADRASCRTAASAPLRRAGTAESARFGRGNSRRSYHFSKSISSASTVSLLRNSAIRMPSPTAASATASVITKMAKICPLTCAAGVRKGHQVDVHGVEDQLDGHQNDHDVAARQHADGADEQQRRAQGQVMNCRLSDASSDPLLGHHHRAHHRHQQQNGSDFEGQQVLAKQHVGHHFGIAHGRPAPAPRLAAAGNVSCPR